MTTKNRAKYYQRMMRVVTYMEKHLGHETLDLNQLAEIACFSPYHFHRQFRSLLGETPNQLYNRIRLHRAANMLLFNPDYSITDIAMKTGFSSSSTFSRAFKNLFSSSPLEWQEQNSKNGKAQSNPGHALDLTALYDGQHVIIQQEDVIMEFSIKSLPGYRIAYVAGEGGYEQQAIETAWQGLMKWAGPQGLVGKQPLIGVSLDNPDITETSQCRYLAGIVTEGDTATNGNVNMMELAAGQHAVLHFKGPASEIKNAYQKIFGELMAQSGYQPDDGPCYELYPADMMSQKPPQEIDMDICVPVKAL